MSRRPHHRRVAEVLGSLDAELLAVPRCWFGGGTAIVLARDDYRESVGVDGVLVEVILMEPIVLDAPSPDDTAVAHLRERPRRLDECLCALKTDATRAQVWQDIRTLAVSCARIDLLSPARERPPGDDS